MNTVKKEPEPVNIQQEVPEKLKNEKRNIAEENISLPEMDEVDDKLIGDDLEIKRAEQVDGDKKPPKENERANY